MRTIKNLSRSKFDDRFGTSENCLKELYNMKWVNGFSCMKCLNDKSCNTKNMYEQRCTKCGYVESSTANTLFHKLKFPIEKAFGMLYEILISKKGANSMLLAERFEVSQNTAWLFRAKVQTYLASSQLHQLSEEVHVDEFEIGTPKKGQQGRSKSEEKTRCVIAVEIRNGSVGNAYCKEIQDFSTESLKPIFETHISKNAYIKTDKWAGYLPLKKDFPNFNQEKSNPGLNFNEIHIQIRNFKNWLRGVHSFCSSERIQFYINEYFFRFNRRNHRESIIDKALRRFVLQKSYSADQLKGIVI